MRLISTVKPLSNSYHTQTGGCGEITAKQTAGEKNKVHQLTVMKDLSVDL